MTSWNEENSESVRTHALPMTQKRFESYLLMVINVQFNVLKTDPEK